MLGPGNVSVGIAPASWDWLPQPVPCLQCDLRWVPARRQGSPGLGAWPCRALLASMFSEALYCLLTSSFPLVLQHSIRALALRVLREILRNQPARFKNYAELTIMKTLEAHKDSHKEVSRPLAQECRADGPGGAVRVWGERGVDQCAA